MVIVEMLIWLIVVAVVILIGISSFPLVLQIIRNLKDAKRMKHEMKLREQEAQRNFGKPLIDDSKSHDEEVIAEMREIQKELKKRSRDENNGTKDESKSKEDFENE